MRTNWDVLPYVGMLFGFWQLEVVKVDMLKFLEVAISGLKSASPADMPAGSAPLVIEKLPIGWAN